MRFLCFSLVCLCAFPALAERMLTDDLEYISARSFIQYRVVYNVHVREDLTAKMNASDLNTAKYEAQDIFIEQAKRLCRPNKQADTCTVFFWEDKDNIPKDKEVPESAYEEAKGRVVISEKKESYIEWGGKKEPLNQRVKDKESQSNE